ncbi:MAG: type II toxin-antitoxin system RelE/ParE family toxin [Candidatus Omnitrophota bacterium]
MDRFEVILLGQAEKFYKKASDDLARCLDLCFEDLEGSPFQGPNIKLLKTQKSVRWYRYRVGDYRVVYEIDREVKKVGVLLILHRSSVYRGM